MSSPFPIAAVDLNAPLYPFQGLSLLFIFLASALFLCLLILLAIVYTAYRKYKSLEKQY